MKYGAVYPSLAGRTVLVTGGGSGIGEAIVRHFAAQGAKVGFIDILEKPSLALARSLARKRLKVHFEKADLTDIDAARKAVAAIRKTLGPVTILVNNAAHDERHTLEDVTPEYFDDRIAVNLKHQFFCIQAVLPDMKKAGGGAIVNMSSVTWMLGFPDLPVYVAAKAAVHGMTRALSRELGQYNVRLNSISPGWIMTERQQRLYLTPEREVQLMKDQTVKRKLYPDDIARLVLFFASDEFGGGRQPEHRRRRRLALAAGRPSVDVSLTAGATGTRVRDRLCPMLGVFSDAPRAHRSSALSLDRLITFGVGVVVVGVAVPWLAPGLIDGWPAADKAEVETAQAHPHQPTARTIHSWFPAIATRSRSAPIRAVTTLPTRPSTASPSASWSTPAQPSWRSRRRPRGASASMVLAAWGASG